jgi:membrane protease YdiL (CAAX protease family)
MEEAADSRPAAFPAEAVVTGSVGQRFRVDWITVLLCVLSVMTIFRMRWAENRCLAEYHGHWHWQSLEKSLLVQSVYEKEPRALRWLSGYLLKKSFYREQSAHALAAERDGYLLPKARQAMALVAHRAGDFQKVAYWRDGPPRGRHWQKLPQEHRDAIRAWQPGDRPEILGILSSSGGTVPTELASRFYWKSVGAALCLFFGGILFFPCGRAAVRLLRGLEGAPAVQGDVPAVSWQPGMMLGGWLRASWVFGMSGLALTTCYYFAWLGQNDGVRVALGGWDIELPAMYLRFHQGVFGGWHRHLIGPVFLLGPVYLLASRFAGGVRGMWRIFGLGFSGMAWRNHFRAAAGGTWIAMTVMVVTWPICQHMGWLDNRDAWRFVGESWPVALFYGCLLAPLTEELVFRGFLFSAFAKRWPAGRAALFSSLIFAGVHGYSLVGFVVVVGYGMLFCGLYRRTGSLWPGMLAHAMINSVLLVEQFVF